MTKAATTVRIIKKLKSRVRNLEEQVQKLQTEMKAVKDLQSRWSYTGPYVVPSVYPTLDPAINPITIGDPPLDPGLVPPYTVTPWVPNLDGGSTADPPPSWLYPKTISTCLKVGQGCCGCESCTTWQ